MIELMLTLMGAAIATTTWSVLEQRRVRRSLEQAQGDLRADREILARAAQANESLASELTRQRDSLASLEMRVGAPPSRGFTPTR